MNSSTLVLRPATLPWQLEPHLVDDAPSIRLFDRDAESSRDDLTSNASRRGMWALADQGVVSLGNCATNIMLARGLAVAQFGIYAIVLEAMIFLNSLQAALVIYPLSLRGAVLDERGLRRITGACLVLTLLLGIPLMLALIVATNFVGSVPTGVIAAAALVLWQIQETLRRAMMAQGGHRKALAGDIVSYLGQAGAVALLFLTGTLSVERAFAAVGVSSALAILIQAWQIKPGFADLRDLPTTVRDFWRLGRWVMLGSCTAIVTTLGCSWTLTWFHGTTAIGQFQALANFMKLSNPLTIAVAGLIVPAAARAFRFDGIAAARRVAMKFGALTATLLAPYYLTLLLFPVTAIQLLYGEQSSFRSLGTQLRAFVLWYSALFLSQIVGCYLNAIEESRRSFYAQAMQMASVVVLSIPLTAIYGLDGLMLGGVIGNLVMAAGYLSQARRIRDLSPIIIHRRIIREEMQHSSRMAA